MASLFPNCEPNSAEIMDSKWWQMSEGVSKMQENMGAKGPPTTSDDMLVSLFFGALFFQVCYALQPDLFSLRQPGFAFLCYEKVTLWNTEGQSWGAAEHSERLWVFSRSPVRTHRLTEWCRMECFVHDLLTFDSRQFPTAKGKADFMKSFRNKYIL